MSAATPLNLPKESPAQETPLSELNGVIEKSRQEALKAIPSWVWVLIGAVSWLGADKLAFFWNGSDQFKELSAKVAKVERKLDKISAKLGVSIESED